MKGLFLPARGSGLIWSWPLKKINKLGYNPIDPPSMQTQTSELLNARIALVFFKISPLAIFFQGISFPLDLCLEPKWSVVVIGSSEETSVELLISVRPCAGQRNTKGIRLDPDFQEILTLVRISWCFPELTSHHFLLFMKSLEESEVYVFSLFCFMLYNM